MLKAATILAVVVLAVAIRNAVLWLIGSPTRDPLTSLGWACLLLLLLLLGIWIAV